MKFQSHYEKGDFVLEVLPNFACEQVDMFIKNKKLGLAFATKRSTIVAKEIHKTTYSTIFTSHTDTSERNIYDEEKIMLDMFDFGVAVIDFIEQCTSKIIKNEKENIKKMFSSMNFTINEYKEG